jgi:hypothetical protein
MDGLPKCLAILGCMLLGKSKTMHGLHLVINETRIMRRIACLHGHLSGSPRDMYVTSHIRRQGVIVNYRVANVTNEVGSHWDPNLCFHHILWLECHLRNSGCSLVASYSCGQDLYEVIKSWGLCLMD